MSSMKILTVPELLGAPGTELRNHADELILAQGLELETKWNERTIVCLFQLALLGYLQNFRQF